ncbi:hypothetical protein ACGF5O_27825 [Streptomyces sp. NPDC048291]|uniref:hypothetical protein n=1 Tax=Streptomyces sp. NPDC048291 TaxID=3365530 RepID=UPI0037153124
MLLANALGGDTPGLGGNLQSLIQLALTVSGATVLPACLYSRLPGQDIHWIGLQSTGLIAIPAGFALGWTGSRLARRGGFAAAADAEAAWRHGL